MGIVGFGRCGQLAARILGEHFRLKVTDRRDLSVEAAEMGVAWTGIADAAGQPHVILAVPIRALPEVLDEISPCLRPDALVVDLCSVKVRPLRWMVERLPKEVQPVGTHPLFGPESAREQGVGGQRIAICSAPGREDGAARVAEVCTQLGLEPVSVSAEEHDRIMARSQAVVFLIARALRRAGVGLEEPLGRARLAELGTPSERRFLSALELVMGDTEELYEDLVRYNPHGLEALDRLGEAIRAEVERLAGG